MKIELHVVDGLKLQASFRKLVGNKGGIFTVYFFSGERYEHWIAGESIGSEQLDLRIENDQGEDRGHVTFTGETEEEKKMLCSVGYDNFLSRDKETAKFFLIKRTEVEPEDGTFQHIRNF